jgi:hypothetical protein
MGLIREGFDYNSVLNIQPKTAKDNEKFTNSL